MIKDELVGGNSLLLHWIAFSYYLLLQCSLSFSNLTDIFFRRAYSISAALITAMSSEVKVDSKAPPRQASIYKSFEVSSQLSKYFNLAPGLMPFSYSFPILLTRNSC